MSLNPNENKWVKATLILLAIIAVIGVWAYLAGGIFMVAFNHKFEEGTPLTLYQYWFYMGKQPQVIKWIYISGFTSLTLLLLPFVFLFAGAKRSLFGDARFASKFEIKKAGLFGVKGIIVGELNGKYLTFDGQQHAIISAPTRSGKGVGIVIPNLLNWPDSVVVLDIKQENWDITSKYRAKYGQACFLFNPVAADYRTHRYNPLSYISEDPNFRIDDVQKIANMLYPDQAGTDLIWTATPRSLFLGVVLYLAETPEKPMTLGQVLRETLQDGDGSEYFTKIINERASSNNPLSGACVRALNSYISISAENTRAGVMTGFRSRLELWQNPLVDAATSANDFDLREVRKQRMSIYIGVTPDNLERMAPIINLFFQQLIDLNTRVMPNKDKSIKYTCLLLMDEFTSIGKIQVLSKGISFIAGYWLRMMPIIQSPAQVVEVYGKEAAQTFTTNHALNIIFPPKASETQTAKDISEWLGYQTVKGVSESKSKNLLGKKSPTESHSDQRRALLLPQEITSLGSKAELIIMEDVPPILANKIRYFKDNVFINRLKEVSPQLRKLEAKLPLQAELDHAITTGELGAPVPLIDLNSFVNDTQGEAPLTIKTKTKKSGKTVIERNVMPEDLPKLAKLALSDFVIDFSNVKPVPPPNEINIEALNAYADSMCLAAGINLN